MKLVGVDLDGTLLYDHNIIDDYTLNVLEKAHKKGMQIVTITGRPFSGIPEGMRKSEIFRYYITSNGAQIIDSKRNERLFSRQIGNSEVLDILSRLKPYDCMIEAFTEDYGHINNELYEIYKNKFTGTVLENYIFSSRKVVENVGEYIRKNKKSCDEIFVICKEKQTRDNLYNMLIGTKGVHIFKFADIFIEITAQGVNKGSSLNELCRKLNIDAKDTIAFGDGDNDIEFLEQAGISVAMENACDAVKEIADIIAPSNTECGVAKILEKYI